MCLRSSAVKIFSLQSQDYWPNSKHQSANKSLINGGVLESMVLNVVHVGLFQLVFFVLFQRRNNANPQASGANFKILI